MFLQIPHGPIPIHLQKCFSELGGKPGDFPEAERLGAEELSLPMYPELTEDMAVQVVEALSGHSTKR